jgi:hypothetical protein
MVNAQAPSYAFVATTGTYTPIAGGTATITSGDYDDGFSNGIPIGFTFNYNGTNYTTVSASANGWMTLGQNINVTSSTNNLASGGNRPVLAPLYEDLHIGSNANLTYTTTGASGSRVLTMQWANVMWDFAASNPSISFQVKLYEGTNIIEFIYKQESGAVQLNSSGGASIGITATANNAFLSLDDATANPNISTTTSYNNISVRPATGQIYRWIPFCTSSSNNTTTTGEKISNVTFGFINNNSTSAAGYENFSSLSSYIIQGSTVPLTINVSNPKATDQAYVWIYFNHNGSFSDAGELVYTSPVAAGPYTTNISIPAIGANVFPGYTRMRVRLQDTNVSPTNNTSCGNAEWGQVEDYSLDINYCNAGTFTLQPSSVTVCNGGSTSITASATGTFLSYQWQVSTNGGTSYSNISNNLTYGGETTNTLLINNATAVMNGYKYRLLVGGTCTPANTVSSAATLNINDLGSISTQPDVHKAVCVGKSVSFATVASGSSPTYQWQVSTDGGISYSNISGATAATYTISTTTMSQNGNRYRAIVTVPSCGSLTTSPTLLTVNPLPIVTIAAAPATAISPRQTTYITAGSVNPGVSFSWTLDGNAIAGANGSNISVTFDKAGKYQATVTDANGCTNTTNIVEIGKAPSDTFYLYPNPTSGRFQIRLYNIPYYRRIALYNAAGAMVEQRRFDITTFIDNYQKMEFDMTRFAPGVYTIVLGDDWWNKSVIGGRVIVIR